MWKSIRVEQNGGDPRRRIKINEKGVGKTNFIGKEIAIEYSQIRIRRVVKVSNDLEFKG